MSELAVDQILDDKYRIVRKVGRGAWATVYEAVNVRIQRRVAIKVLNAELVKHPQLVARFSREAQAATQIESPFVVTMFDAGTIESKGWPYIVMEFLVGEDLGRRLRREGALREAKAVAYAIHVLSGLADAHATGILHRDIKPDNLVIVTSKTGEEILKLVDFGISKPNTRPDTLPASKTEEILGSPVYMSPEQARGTRFMDHRSDLYSVGVVLFEALTNAVPHVGADFNDLMFKVALKTAPDPRTKKPDLDEELAKIVVKALSRDPSSRFQSAVEFRAALMQWAELRGANKDPLHSTSKQRLRAVDPRDSESGEENFVALVRTKESQPTTPAVASSSEDASTASAPPPSSRGGTLPLARPLEAPRFSSPGSGPPQPPPSSDPRSTAPLPFRPPAAPPYSDPRLSSPISGAPPAIAASVTTPITGPPRTRGVLPLVLGGVALFVLGSAMTFALTRSRRAVSPPTVSAVVAPPSTSAAWPALVPAASVAAPPVVASAEPAVAASVAAVATPTTTASAPPRKRRVAPATPHVPSKPAAETKAAASNEVIEGRAVRTSF